MQTCIIPYRQTSVHACTQAHPCTYIRYALNLERQAEVVGEEVATLGRRRRIADEPHGRHLRVGLLHAPLVAVSVLPGAALHSCCRRVARRCNPALQECSTASQECNTALQECNGALQECNPAL